MKSKLLCLGLVSAMFLAVACSSSDDDTTPGTSSGIDGGTNNTDGGKVTAEQKAAAVKQYATLVYANYKDSLAQMKTVQAAIDAFVANPTQATHDAAKAAWTAARPAYLQTEAFRFYNGPIDNEEDGPEGAINGWPLDENYIDYVIGDDEAGIINKKNAEGTAFLFPEITKDVIAEENEKGGEKNLSAGWHAIEFLLWGQDLNADNTPHAEGPGQRSYTDFVDGGTHENQDRRRAYIKAATDLMVEQFEAVVVQWDLSNAESYGAKFVAGSADEAIGNILKGAGSLAATELPKERMNNAYETKDQEEEHSCFSDTTNQDMDFDGLGIENVYLGRYGSVTGASLSDLVKTVDPALDTKIRADITAALAATNAIPKPFDNALAGDDNSDGRKKLKAAIDSWTPVANDIVQVADALGVKINLE